MKWETPPPGLEVVVEMKKDKEVREGLGGGEEEEGEGEERAGEEDGEGGGDLLGEAGGGDAEEVEEEGEALSLRGGRQR